MGTGFAAVLLVFTIYAYLLGKNHGREECEYEHRRKSNEKIERYEKALNFYADEENYEAWAEYENATGYFNNVDFDSGDNARNALEGKTVQKKVTAER